jgi:hypothetical protein
VTRDDSGATPPDHGAVAQRQEAQDLGSWQCGFESHRPHQIGQCTNTRHCAATVGVFCARGLRDAEHRDDAAGSGDLDLGDQSFDEHLALSVGARADDFIDVVSDLPECGGRRRGGCEGELAGELVAAGAQLPGSGLELSKSPGEVFRVEGAVLERPAVLVS